MFNSLSAAWLRDSKSAYTPLLIFTFKLNFDFFDRKLEREEEDEDGILAKDRVVGILNLLSPVNSITAANSAVHYNESLYAYVGNNPMNFFDPLGLDTAKGELLSNVTVKGYIYTKVIINPWAQH